MDRVIIAMAALGVLLVVSGCLVHAFNRRMRKLNQARGNEYGGVKK